MPQYCEVVAKLPPELARPIEAAVLLSYVNELVKEGRLAEAKTDIEKAAARGVIPKRLADKLLEQLNAISVYLQALDFIKKIGEETREGRPPSEEEIAKARELAGKLMTAVGKLPPSLQPAAARLVSILGEVETLRYILLAWQHLKAGLNALLSGLEEITGYSPIASVKTGFSPTRAIPALSTALALARGELQQAERIIEKAEEHGCVEDNCRKALKQLKDFAWALSKLIPFIARYATTMIAVETSLPYLANEITGLLQALMSSPEQDRNHIAKRIADDYWSIHNILMNLLKLLAETRNLANYGSRGIDWRRLSEILATPIAQLVRAVEQILNNIEEAARREPHLNMWLNKIRQEHGLPKIPLEGGPLEYLNEIIAAVEALTDQVKRWAREHFPAVISTIIGFAQDYVKYLTRFVLSVPAFYIWLFKENYKAGLEAARGEWGKVAHTLLEELVYTIGIPALIALDIYSLLASGRFEELAAYIAALATMAYIMEEASRFTSKLSIPLPEPLARRLGRSALTIEDIEAVLAPQLRLAKAFYERFAAAEAGLVEVLSEKLRRARPGYIAVELREPLEELRIETEAAREGVEAAAAKLEELLRSLAPEVARRVAEEVEGWAALLTRPPTLIELAEELDKLVKESGEYAALAALRELLGERIPVEELARRAEALAAEIRRKLLGDLAESKAVELRSLLKELEEAERLYAEAAKLVDQLKRYEDVLKRYGFKVGKLEELVKEFNEGNLPLFISRAREILSELGSAIQDFLKAKHELVTLAKEAGADIAAAMIARAMNIEQLMQAIREFILRTPVERLAEALGRLHETLVRMEKDIAKLGALAGGLKLSIRTEIAEDLAERVKIEARRLPEPFKETLRALGLPEEFSVKDIPVILRRLDEQLGKAPFYLIPFAKMLVDYLRPIVEVARTYYKELGEATKAEELERLFREVEAHAVKAVEVEWRRIKPVLDRLRLLADTLDRAGLHAIATRLRAMVESIEFEFERALSPKRVKRFMATPHVESMRLAWIVEQLRKARIKPQEAAYIAEEYEALRDMIAAFSPELAKAIEDMLSSSGLVGYAARIRGYRFEPIRLTSKEALEMLQELLSTPGEETVKIGEYEFRIRREPVIGPNYVGWRIRVEDNQGHWVEVEEIFRLVKRPGEEFVAEYHAVKYDPRTPPYELPSMIEALDEYLERLKERLGDKVLLVTSEGVSRLSKLILRLHEELAHLIPAVARALASLPPRVAAQAYEIIRGVPPGFNVNVERRDGKVIVRVSRGNEWLELVYGKSGLEEIRASSPRIFEELRGSPAWPSLREQISEWMRERLKLLIPRAGKPAQLYAARIYLVPFREAFKILGGGVRWIHVFAGKWLNIPTLRISIPLIQTTIPGVGVAYIGIAPPGKTGEIQAALSKPRPSPPPGRGGAAAPSITPTPMFPPIWLAGISVRARAGLPVKEALIL